MKLLFYTGSDQVIGIFRHHKGCKYCSKKAPIINDGWFELRMVYGNSLTANFGSQRSDSVRLINYCPMCGRKL